MKRWRLGLKCRLGELRGVGVVVSQRSLDDSMLRCATQDWNRKRRASVQQWQLFLYRNLQQSITDEPAMVPFSNHGTMIGTPILSTGPVLEHSIY